MRYVFLLMLLLLFSVNSYSVTERTKQVNGKVTVVTENTFPIQYLKDGEVVGFATELVKAVLADAKLPYEIQVLPWARAYRTAINEPNVLIYSLAKTEKRRDKFKWVGEIMALEYYLYGAIDSNINQQTKLDDLKHYRIGVIRDSAVDQYLKSQDFQNLTTVVQGIQNFFLFQEQRIDLLPANKATFQASCRHKLLDCSALKPLYKLAMPATKLYMAFGASSEDSLVERVRASYQQVKSQHAISTDFKRQ
ncbi:amino acid ABC transporter substrate-binding protein, PAAT family [Colwellia chukchiensis]|uniref:Amino acid ABC transporter substrate-binding protein, PAAT family n=1 Tax=Colwellia chukchiensis TaxID=641665 RepID=A0A1H7P7W6_9GAMM|nr:transporter substrate-binding domain-containing protein [Colwellia chukchiensis]SEL31852.1 amino acid ABC transporter substrate-binding protein, PAAT family [Colwellia chukchiensis]